MHVGGDGLGGYANIGKSEVVGDDAAPAVGTKLDLWMRHLQGSCSLNKSVKNRGIGRRDDPQAQVLIFLFDARGADAG